MATVEDGEILEVDNDGVVDLCSDAEPNPSLASPSKPNSSRSRTKRNLAALRANVYRGGDPFVFAVKAQIDVDDVSADKPHFPQAATPYDLSHSARRSLNEVHSPLRPYLSNKEAFLQRDPYVPDNPSSPAFQNVVSEPFHTHPQSYLGRVPSRREMNASPLPTAARTADGTWPYPAPPNDSGVRLGVHAEPQPGSLKSYDPDRYSPGGDQSRFTQGPIYHAEPGPPSSVQYAMYHPSMMPADSNFRGLPFEMAQTQRLHSMNQNHDTPPSMYKQQTFSGIVRTEQGFFIRDTPTVTQRHQNNPESASGFRGERELLHTRHRQVLLKRENSFQQDSYDRTFSSDGHHVAVSDIAADGTIKGFDDSERRRTQPAPLTGSFSDNDAHRASSTGSRDSRERQDCAYGASEGEGCGKGRSVPKEKERQLCPPPLQDDASDGEISSPPIPSPVISLATAPDETPSPPSVKKKKPAINDAKKRLSDLRLKALLSVKRRPAAQNSNSSIQPISPRCSPPTAISTSAELMEELQTARHTQELDDNDSINEVDVQDVHVQSSTSSDEIIPGVRIQTESVMQVVVGGIRRTMTQSQFTQWQEWPYQNRVVVDYSSDSSDNTDDASDAEDIQIRSNAAPPKKSHRSSLCSRERQIEAMKIRMVSLGKCPSMLMGGSKKLKSDKGSTHRQNQQKAEERAKDMNHAKTVTRMSKESTRQEIEQIKAKCDSRDEQSIDQENASSPEHTYTSREMEPRPVTGKAETAADHVSSAKLTGGACQRLLSVSSVEIRASSEQPKNLEVVSDDQSEKIKNQMMHDDKLSSNQTCPKEMNHKDGTAQVKALRPPAGASNENPIAELKKRIAVIEKSRDLLKQQRHKKQRIAIDGETNGSYNAKGLPLRRPSHRNTNIVAEHKQDLQMSKPGKRGRTSAEVDNRERFQNQRSSRYYGPEPSTSVQSLLALKKGDPMDVDVDMSDACCDGSDSSARTNVQGAPESMVEIPQDNAQRRYIDDLKLELELKRKELMDERDHAEQLRTAEVAIAEAQAKLNFTRSRAADLQEELRKAGLDVLNAEKEYQRRVRVAAQLRDANFVDLTESNPEQEYNGRVRYSLEEPGNDVGNVSNDFAIEEDSDIEKGPGEIVDHVLQPSPYSPSTGDYFTSCLRAFRAYLLRIPHHSEAKDRAAGSVLSSTWDVNLDPMKAICPQELRGQCSSKDCDFQHLKVFKTPKDQALRLIEVVERFFSKADREKEAKTIINTRIAIHEGKDAAATISSLISTLCASSKAIPYSCASE